MGLRGQGGERGYAMAALLVTLAIMAVLMSVAMPVWRQEARREKEAELIFRGEQIARAIALFRTKNNNAMPASLDVLVTGRFLRKKFREPMAKDGEWRLITAASGNPNPGQPGNPNPGQPQRGIPPPQQQQPGGQSQVAGGIMGVSSKSTETSLRLYQGANRYDQWQFRFTDVARGRGGVPGANDPAGRGNNPGRGNPGRGNTNQPGRGGNQGVGPGDGGTGFRVPPFGTPGGSRGGAPGGGPGTAPPPSGPGRGVGRGQ
jgi:type II secretory pathway pseudopilin PulG